MKGQASLELLVAVLVLVLCVGAFLGALGKANAAGRMEYWKEKQMLSNQALLAQEYWGVGKNLHMRIEWEEWRANGDVVGSVRNNASAKSAVRVYAGVGAREIEKNWLEGA
ncbi:hypothetical protein J4441_02580 [Candidatus Micrarchaeota archaeon]|nr:hypothetical protein [Candidatus Micrarchaeota archaeon]